MHLAPEKNKNYRGHIVFAVGCCGNDDLNPTVMEMEFGALDGGPWFFDAVMKLIQCNTRRVGFPDHKEIFAAGTVWRFDGSFRNYVFRGKFTRLELSSSKDQIHCLFAANRESEAAWSKIKTG
jgi:hypothetical protein